jgi:hypothetical protein
MSSPGTDRRTTGAYLQGGLLVVAMLVGSLMLWLGFPLLWLWVGSQVTDSSQPSLLPYAVIIIGLGASVIVDYKLLVRLNDRYARVMGVSRMEFRAAWLRSMRDGRTRGITLSVLDRVMIVAVTLAVCSFIVWLVAFSGSPLPGA